MWFRERDEGNWDNNDSGEGIRVTDRRRHYLENADGESTGGEVQAPNLKPSYVEELEARTRAAEQKALDVQERFEQVKRKLQQETHETRQRLNRAADERAERAKAEFIANLLPVLDNLERAIDAAETDGSLTQLMTGVRQTAESFQNALTAAGVEPVAALGEEFDPEFHEAVEIVPVESESDGKVTNVYTRGYRLGDRLLRPAKVAVGRAAEKAQSANE